MNETGRNNEENIGAAVGRLCRLQGEIDNLEKKLNKTVTNLQSLIEERNEEPDVFNSEIENTERSLEGNVRRRAVIDKPPEEESILVKLAAKIDSTLTKQPDNNTKDNFEVKTITWRTCDYWSLPHWLKSNGFILKGYRPPLPTFQQCIYSIFRIHTETVNIWTHLLGCLIFIILFLYTLVSSLSIQDKLLLFPFFVGAILCFFLSSIFHTLQCHSELTLIVTSRLDYCGITLLILGSYVPWLNYGFYCDNRVKNLYLAGVGALGICALVLSLSETFNKPLYRPLRATVFAVFGLSGLIPSVHFFILYGWNSFITMALPLIPTGVLYITGTIIYAVRFPERISPGKFDILFQSHQVFHVLVLLATLVDYFGILQVVDFIHSIRSNPDFCEQKQFYYSKPFDLFVDF